MDQDTASKKILLASFSALLLAGLILVTTVLPAEYGIDPLGSGELLGLSSLADEGSIALVSQAVGFKQDEMQFILAPFESVEYKYRLKKGASMLFSWKATGVVNYDMHSEPDGAPQGYAESFDKKNSSVNHGSYIAPYNGIHGWFWENRGSREVAIDLRTTGFYSKATLFRDGFAHERKIDSGNISSEMEDRAK